MIQPVFTHFAADSSASGIGALGLDWRALIIQLITFGLAYLVLRKYAFGPIMKVMNERRETIDKGVTLGEQMQKQQAKAEAEVAKKLTEAQTHADSIVATANDEARAKVREAEEKAQAKAQSILSDAENRIAQDTQRARQKLEKELVGLVSEATEAIVGEKVDSKKDAELIDRALKRAA